MTRFARTVAEQVERKRLAEMNEAFAERMRAAHPGTEGVKGPDPNARPAVRAPRLNTDLLRRNSPLA